jgi:hypothetical protein
VPQLSADGSLDARTDIMDLIHALLGSLFTILITASVSFIAYKVLMIGNDVSEMKETLKQLQRENTLPESVINRFPTPLPDFDASSDAGAPDKEFVLPPPISRRLDAERGIQRDATDDLSLGLKSSGQRH